jgi:hypothetical protein
MDNVFVKKRMRAPLEERKVSNLRTTVIESYLNQDVYALCNKEKMLLR